MKEILIPLNFSTTPTLYDSKQSFSASDDSSGVLVFTTTADVSGTVASLTIRNASENANRQTVLVERLDVNSSPFSYAVKMPLPFGAYEGELLLKKNLTTIASAKFLFGVNSSLSAEVLPKLVEAYSLDALVESVETEVSVLKDAYTLTVSETVKGVNKTEQTVQLSENVRYLAEESRKVNNLLWKTQAEAHALAEEGRVTEFGNLLDSTVIEQTVTQEVAEKYQQIEATQANRLLTAEQQLEQIELNKADLADLPSSAYVFKGSTTFATLPTTGNTLGDVRWTTDNLLNYAWTGTAWTPIGNGAFADGSVVTKKLANNSVKIEKIDSVLRNNISLLKKITSRNLIESVFYNGALVSTYFYDATNKLATFDLPDVTVLDATKYYQADLFFSDGTKATNLITIDFLQDTTIVSTTVSANRKLIGAVAPTVNKVRFSFGADARTGYATKTISGFALYENPTTNDTLLAYDPFTFTHEITDVETLKTDVSTAKTDITGLKSGVLIAPHAITVNKVDFIEILNKVDTAKIYTNKTLVTGVLTDLAGSTVVEIPVTPATIYFLTQYHADGGKSGLYDASFAFLGNFFTLSGFAFNANITTPANCYYLRFVLLDTYAAGMFFGNQSNYNDWLSGYNGRLTGIKSDVGANVVDAFLPSEIYVAVGTTIEIYNNQVCLQAPNYHVQWVCTVGRAMERKFVVQGVTGLIGNYTLTLNIFDDDLALVWTGSTTVKIVDATLTNNYTYVALGDSLTAGKAWLAEVKKLSASKLTTVGRIPYNGILDSVGASHNVLCDGRGGFSAASYLTATTSDDTTSGGINEGVHAFWSVALGRFSWSYYVTNTLSGVAPSFVQIFLGTNAIGLDPTINANNIKAIVDYIRQDAPTLPIYLVNTLYRGNQDGIGKQGSNEGYSASSTAYKYEEDLKVFKLMVRLSELLGGYTNLHFMPIAPTFDSEYNFGAVTTPVNPRSTQTEVLPVESVHPVTYWQMADTIWSTLAGTLV